MCCQRAGFFEPDGSGCYGDLFPGIFHHLAVADLASFAQLNLTVYLDLTLGYHHLGRAAASAQAGDLQQIIQCDRVVAFKTEFTHDLPCFNWM